MKIQWEEYLLRLSRLADDVSEEYESARYVLDRVVLEALMKDLGSARKKLAVHISEQASCSG